MQEDILEFLKVKKQFAEAKKYLRGLPREGSEYINNAKEFETMCWMHSNIVTDLIYKVHKYERNKKQDKENTLNDKKSECDEKSDAAKERYAKSTDEYRDVAKEYAESEALLEWFRATKVDLTNGVYVMRSAGQAVKTDYNSMPDNGE